MSFNELQLKGVSRHFANPAAARVLALSELTVTVPRGEFVALLGPSGCGKTTALNCIAGLLPLTSGSIWLDELRIDVLPSEKRGFGMVFQNYALFPHMTVRRNVGFGLRMRGIATAQAERRVARALSVLRTAVQDESVTAGVEELGRWLEEFHPRSLVELDYGGLVHLLDVVHEVQMIGAAQNEHLLG